MPENPFNKFDVSETTLTPIVSDPLTEDIKNPFSETQNKAASFAYRQLKAIEETDALIAGGYNPSTDILNYIASALPDVFEGLVTTSEYKQWQRAVTDLSTAQLRPETGAVINDTEIVWIDETMWDKIWDGEEVRKDKREARYRAYMGNKVVAGKAYDKLVKEMEAGDQEKIQNDSYNSLTDMYNNGKLNEEQELKYLELQILRKQQNVK
jgi:hypothetical protein|tara:strand:- start:88 stop:717 length:630 start_codon:yes stop_codon:yes gene_type:complete